MSLSRWLLLPLPSWRLQRLISRASPGKAAPEREEVAAGTTRRNLVIARFRGNPSCATP